MDLKTLVKEHSGITIKIVQQLKEHIILKLYRDYLIFGAYPFYREGVRDYPIKLIEVVRQMIDSDLAVIYAIDKENLHKLNRIKPILKRFICLPRSVMMFLPRIRVPWKNRWHPCVWLILVP